MPASLCKKSRQTSALAAITYDPDLANERVWDLYTTSRCYLGCQLGFQGSPDNFATTKKKWVITTAGQDDKDTDREDNHMLVPLMDSLLGWQSAMAPASRSVCS